MTAAQRRRNTPRPLSPAEVADRESIRQQSEAEESSLATFFINELARREGSA